MLIYFVVSVGGVGDPSPGTRYHICIGKLHLRSIDLQQSIIPDMCCKEKYRTGN